MGFRHSFLPSVLPLICVTSFKHPLPALSRGKLLHTSTARLLPRRPSFCLLSSWGKCWLSLICSYFSASVVSTCFSRAAGTQQTQGPVLNRRAVWMGHAWGTRWSCLEGWAPEIPVRGAVSQTLPAGVLFTQLVRTCPCTRECPEMCKCDQVCSLSSFLSLCPPHAPEPFLGTPSLPPCSGK